MKRIYFILFVLSIFAIGTVLFEGNFIANANAEVAIEVNGVKVDKEVVESEIEQNFEQLKNQYAEHLEDDPEFEERLINHVQNQVVERHVNHLVLKTNAEDEGIKIGDMDIEKKLQQTASQYPTEEAYMQALSQAGYTPETYKKTIKEQMKIDAYIQQNVEEPNISENEARQIFNENREMFGGEEVSFDKVKEQIIAQLHQQQWEKSVQDFILKLKADADISVNL
jgi:hypothetical protein